MKINIDLMQKLCKLNKDTLKEVLAKYLKSKGYSKVIRSNMFVIAEGDLPLCLCAHLDTVFPSSPVDIYYDNKKTVMWSPQGLGADDRAGIYAIISLLEKGYKPSIIFTDLEEKGGVGADSLVEHFPHCPFKDCKAIIQLDRRGAVDSVYYDCDSEIFEKKINSYGFKTEWGTFTDISIICPKWGIAGVNLSVGYYNEHHYIETLNMVQLHSTIHKVEKMLQECKTWKKYKYIPLKHGYITTGSGWWGLDKCVCCGKLLDTLNGHYYYGGDPDKKNDYLVCDDCYTNYFAADSSIVEVNNASPTED